MSLDCTSAFAASALAGQSLSPLLAVPFAGLLLSIALLPIFAAQLWHAHYGKISTLWSLLTLIPLMGSVGLDAGLSVLFHTLMLDYLPFILMLFALFTVSGGIVISGHMPGTPRVNTTLLACGAVLASFIGTTGAAMVMVRSLLRANAGRKHQAHVMVFFIFIVANIGGALTPLGDPPLFLGFLKGVSFFWPLQHLWPATAFALITLLIIFYCLDSLLSKQHTEESEDLQLDEVMQPKLKIAGWLNILLVGCIIAAILISGLWRPGPLIEILGTTIEGQNLFRDVALLCIGVLSIVLTPKAYRVQNEFSFEPIREVARLFLGIFICIIPVLSLLAEGLQGPFAPLLHLIFNMDGTPNNPAIFWLAGGLSSMLDNAPTYLVFFELAGGDAARLMGPMATTLMAISLGSVFMGANTYIGNAPNFMVYSIAREAGVAMPSFFGYMLWSSALLLPLFGLIHFFFL
ncbi:MAG: sodium:proton antiporter [Alphaproteobacteria bacterium]|nr:sodium:proton antiporter [Alphaproteobacteria bacterium]